MTVFWHFYWPLAAAAFIIGVLAARYGFRLAKPDEPPPGFRAKRRRMLLLGALAALAATALWHGPLGAGSRLASTIENSARAQLDKQEMTSVQARVARRPLRRTLLLSGPADDFQRGELVRILNNLSGVGGARWINPPSRGGAYLPVLAEALILAAFAFGLGILLAYLLELKRRSDSDWRW
ncbi:MAG TPA: hypothetical protein VF637_10910 [Sphingomicrobium sp.]|jgi:hypothetical protein